MAGKYEFYMDSAMTQYNTAEQYSKDDTRYHMHMRKYLHYLEIAEKFCSKEFISLEHDCEHFDKKVNLLAQLIVMYESDSKEYLVLQKMQSDAVDEWKKACEAIKTFELNVIG